MGPMIRALRERPSRTAERTDERPGQRGRAVEFASPYAKLKNRAQDSDLAFLVDLRFLAGADSLSA